MIDTLVGISPGSALDAIRARRPRRARTRRRAIARCSRRRFPATSPRRSGSPWQLRHRPARRGATAAFYAAGFRRVGPRRRCAKPLTRPSRKRGPRPLRQLPGGSPEPRGHRRADLSRRRGDPACTRSASRRGLRAHAPARPSPARRRLGRAPGAARRRLVDHRYRDALPDRRLPVLPDSSGCRIAHSRRPP